MHYAVGHPFAVVRSNYTGGTPSIMVNTRTLANTIARALNASPVTKRSGQ